MSASTSTYAGKRLFKETKRKRFLATNLPELAKNNFPLWQTYFRSHWTLAAREMSTEIARVIRYNIAAFLERNERTSFPYMVSKISPAFLDNFSKVIVIMVDCFAEHYVLKDICPRELSYKRSLLVLKAPVGHRAAKVLVP